LRLGILAAYRFNHERTISMLLALYETSAPSTPSAGFAMSSAAILAAALGLCLLAGLLIGLLLWGIKNPVVWRLLSAFGMAVGSGLLVWGIVSAATCEPAPFDSPAGTIGAGAGILVGSITLLVISFLGRSPRQG
jgi:hypothetical protein